MLSTIQKFLMHASFYIEFIIQWNLWIADTRFFKDLSVIKKCTPLGGSLTKTVTFETKLFVRYLGCPLLGGFTVIHTSLHKKWSFLLSISALNETKSAVSYIFEQCVQETSSLLVFLCKVKGGFTRFMVENFHFLNLPTLFAY